MEKVTVFSFLGEKANNDPCFLVKKGPKRISKNKTEHSKATAKDNHVNWRSDPEALNSFKKM